MCTVRVCNSPACCNYCMCMQKGWNTSNYKFYGKHICIFCDCLLGDFYKHHECDSALEKNFKNGKYHIKCRKFKQGCTMFVLRTRLLSWHCHTKARLRRLKLSNHGGECDCVVCRFIHDTDCGCLPVIQARMLSWHQYFQEGLRRL